jgi:hypothetical protein
MKNPIEKRRQAEGLKKLAETFLGRKNFSWWAIFYASLIFIVTGWLPDGIAELLRGEWLEGSCKLISSLAILFFIGYKLKKAFKHTGRIEVKREEPPPTKVLAIFLSPLVRKLKPEDIENAIKARSFSKTKNTLNGTEWEMPVKAIEHHSPEVVYVLTSEGSTGTTNLMPLFQTTIEKLFPSVIKVVEFPKGGIDFEDIRKVFSSIEDLYREAIRKGFKEDEIIVDITGGQKTNSIAGAIATLSIGRKFQYISTRDKKVSSYDVGYFEEE